MTRKSILTLFRWFHVNHFTHSFCCSDHSISNRVDRRGHPTHCECGEVTRPLWRREETAESALATSQSDF